MTARDFCYWLQGFFEIHASAQKSYPPSLDAAQTDILKRHLAMVFKHEIDPSMGPPEHQKLLDDIHKAAAAQQRIHAAGCQMDTDHQGACETRRPQIGGTGPGGTVYRC